MFEIHFKFKIQFFLSLSTVRSQKLDQFSAKIILNLYDYNMLVYYSITYRVVDKNKIILKTSRVRQTIDKGIISLLVLTTFTVLHKKFIIRRNKL
jgi:hypothetical protein